MTDSWQFRFDLPAWTAEIARVDRLEAQWRLGEAARQAAGAKDPRVGALWQAAVNAAAARLVELETGRMAREVING